MTGSGQYRASGICMQKVSNNPNYICRLIVMSGWVVATKVREIGRQPIPFGNHDLNTIISLLTAKALGADGQPQLKRHVESREFIFLNFRS